MRMRQILKLWLLGGLLFVAACGKNDPFVPAGQFPAPGQAPPPAGGGYYQPGGYYGPNQGGYPPGTYPNYYPYPGGYPGSYPGGGYPINPGYYYPSPTQYAPSYPGPGSGYPAPYFYPQLPSGYPSQYYPYLPIDHYMRRTPQLAPYWNQFWNQWVSHAGYIGRDPYDFSYFWRVYCPQQWAGTSYWDLYQYFDQQFYHWVDVSYWFDTGIGPTDFWYHYVGHPYVDVDYYGYCGGYCNYYY